MTVSSAPVRRWLALPRLGLVCIGLLFGGLAIGLLLGGVMPLPYAPETDDVAAYVRNEPAAIFVIATAVFASAIPLAIYVAKVSARLRLLGATRPATATALTGGSLAAAALALTGVLGWVLLLPGSRADAVVARSVYFMAFLVGGPGHLMALGFLVAGIAVPSLTLGLLPEALTWTGLVIAALAEVTILALAWPLLGFILPIARVAALVWLVVVGARL